MKTIKPLSYEDLCCTYLEEACWQVINGVQHLALAGTFPLQQWEEELKPLALDLEEELNVLIRCRVLPSIGDPDSVSVLVSKYEWCFDLWNHAERQKDRLRFAITQMLMGHSSNSIHEFLEEIKKVEALKDKELEDAQD